MGRERRSEEFLRRWRAVYYFAWWILDRAQCCLYTEESGTYHSVCIEPS